MLTPFFIALKNHLALEVAFKSVFYPRFNLTPSQITNIPYSIPATGANRNSIAFCSGPGMMLRI